MTGDRHIEDTADRVPVEIAVEGKSGDLDFSTLKTGGLIKQRQKNLFTVRLKCPGGRVQLDRLAKIAKVARQYGGDYVHLSVRQSIEIPYVNFRDFGKVRDALAEVGQEIASCGARVRVPTACSGCEYNPNGLTETQQMATRVCDRFFGAGRFVHKFKMSFSGCPIDCADERERPGLPGRPGPRMGRGKVHGVRPVRPGLPRGRHRVGRRGLAAALRPREVPLLRRLRPRVLVRCVVRTAGRLGRPRRGQTRQTPRPGSHDRAVRPGRAGAGGH